MIGHTLQPGEELRPRFVEQEIGSRERGNGIGNFKSQLVQSNNQSSLNLSTLHYITLHYITLHYITLHYITLHYITLHYTLYYITLHYITLLPQVKPQLTMNFWHSIIE